MYSVFPVNIVRGKGCEVYDEKGQAYLDLYGGHAVISVGHSHPYLVKCMSEQLQQLMFYSNSVVNKLQERLAYELGELSGYPDYRAFFVNSGAEANENALKLASFHTGKKRVVAFRNSFHGRTSAAVEVTDNPALHAPINTNHNVYFADLDIKEVETELTKGDVCAVILEGISGVGGIQVRVNNIAIFDNIIMARLFRSKRTSKILNLIYNTQTDRHRTNSSSINILLIPFLQNFTKGYSLPRTLAYPIHLFLINNRLN